LLIEILLGNSLLEKPKKPINTENFERIGCQIPVLKVLGLNPNGITTI